MVTAIHPRGRQWEREKPPKKGFALKAGKTLKERLDWIAASVADLIKDFDFDAKTNALLHSVASRSGMITDSMGPEHQLHEYMTLANLSTKMAETVQKLYAKGALPEHVDRKMIHTLLDEVKEIEKSREALKRQMEKYEEFKKGLAALGFKG